MIARNNPRHHGLDKTILMTFRNLARKGTDVQLEDFLYRACMVYMTEVRDTDVIDPEEYLHIKGKKFECQCPNCQTILELDLEDLVK